MKKTSLLVSFLLLTVFTFGAKAPIKTNNPYSEKRKEVKKAVKKLVSIKESPLCLSETLALPCSEIGSRITVASCCVTADCTIWDLFMSNDGQLADYCFWQVFVG